MPNAERIGLYLSDQSIVISNLNRGKLHRINSISVSDLLNVSVENQQRNETTDEIQTISYIQKTFRDNKTTPGQVCISIPNSEIFLRSFIIPFMSSAEMNNAVFYEAKKYLPFDLKLLEYMYQPVLHQEGNQKKWRIIFYAVRKQTLEKYDRIIKQIGGKSYIYEPSLVSLAKYLLSKNLLKLEQSTIVIYLHGKDVQIVFYQNAIAYFVREFVLTDFDSSILNGFNDNVRQQILREVRKSIGYYTSQFSEGKIKDLLFLSSIQDTELVKTLTDEIGLKVHFGEPSVTSGLQKYIGIDSINVAGVCIDKVPSKFTSFNFLSAKSMQQSTTGSNLNIVQMFGLTATDFKPAIQSMIICVLLLGVLFYFTNTKLTQIKTTNDRISLKEGVWQSGTVEQISGEITSFKNKLDSFTKLNSDKTHIAAALAIIIKSLPKNIWLDSLRVSYNSKMLLNIEIVGYVYLNSKGSEYKALNEFLDNLRGFKYLSGLSLNVTSQQKREIKGRSVLTFTVSGI